MAGRPPGRDGGRRRHARAERGQVVRLPVGRFGVMLRAIVVRGTDMNAFNGKFMIAAAAIFTAAAGEAGAGAKENVIKHIGQAMAIDTMCDRYEINLPLAVTIALANGIDLAGADKEAVSAEAKRVIAALARQDQNIVCMSGLALYGPSGESVADLILEK